MKGAVVYVFGPITVTGTIFFFVMDMAKTNIVLCILGVCLFAVYLLIDLSMIISGDTKYEFAELPAEKPDGSNDVVTQAVAVPGAHIKAAVCIWIDIVSIFLFILSMIES